MPTSNPDFVVTAVVDGERFGILFEKRLSVGCPYECAYFFLDGQEGLRPSGEVLRLCGNRWAKLYAPLEDAHILRELRAYAEQAKRTGSDSTPMKLSQTYRSEKGYASALSHFLSRGGRPIRDFVGGLRAYTSLIVRKLDAQPELVGMGACFRVRRQDQVLPDEELRYLQRAKDVLDSDNADFMWFRKTGPSAADLRSTVYRPSSLVAQVMDLLQDSPIALLEGEPASGKSVVARTIALDICERRKDPVYWFAETSSPSTTSTPLLPPDPFGLAAEINSRQGLIVLEDVHRNTPLYQLVCSRIRQDGDRRVLLTARPNHRSLADARFDSLCRWPCYSLTPFAYAQPLLDHYRTQNPSPDVPWTEADMQAILRVSQNNYWLLCYALRGYETQPESCSPREWIREGVRLDLDQLKRYQVDLPQALVSLAPLSSRETWTAEPFLTETLGFDSGTLQELLRRGEVLVAEHEGVGYYRIPHASLASAYWDAGHNYRRLRRLPECAEFLFHYARSDARNGLTAVLKSFEHKDAVLAQLDAHDLTREAVERECNLYAISEWAVWHGPGHLWLSDDRLLNSLAQKLNGEYDRQAAVECIRGVYNGDLVAGNRLWSKLDHHELADTLWSEGPLEWAYAVQRLALGSKLAAIDLLHATGLSRVALAIGEMQTLRDITSVLANITGIGPEKMLEACEVIDVEPIADLLLRADLRDAEVYLIALYEVCPALAGRVAQQLDVARLASRLSSGALGPALGFGVELLRASTAVGRAALQQHVLPRLQTAPQAEVAGLLTEYLPAIARTDGRLARKLCRELGVRAFGRVLSRHGDLDEALHSLHELHAADARWGSTCAAQMDHAVIGLRLSVELPIRRLSRCLHCLEEVNEQVASRVCEYLCIPLAGMNIDASPVAGIGALSRIVRINLNAGRRLWRHIRDESIRTKAMTYRLIQEKLSGKQTLESCAITGEPCEEPSVPFMGGGRAGAATLRKILNGETVDISIGSTRRLARCLSCDKPRVARRTGQSCALCPTCVDITLQLLTYGDPPELWPVDRVMAAVRCCIAPERYALVERAKQVRSKLVGHADLLSSFDELVVGSLGFTARVPIARQIRAAALEACVTIGPELMPKLIESMRLRPWQAYFNTLYALLLMMPEHAQVRELLEKAACDGRRIVREGIIEILGDCDSAWARDVLQHQLDVERSDDENASAS